MSSEWRAHLDELGREMEFREQQLEFREQQLIILNKIDVWMIDHSSTLAQTLYFIIGELQRALQAAYVDILFEYADGLRVELSSDKKEEKRLVPLDQSISGLALSNAEPILENDVQTNRELSSRYFPRTTQDGTGTPPGVSVIAARISLDNHPIGVINVESSEGQTFSPAQAEFVAAIAAQVSMVIAHATLFDEDKLRTETDAMLFGDTVSDSEVVMRSALNQILATLKSFGFIDADAAEVLFVDPQDPDLLMVAYSTNESDIGVRVGVGNSVCGAAFSTRTTIVLPRAREHEQYKPLQEGMNCEMAIPIQLGGNERFSIGVLNIESERENAFSRVAQVLAERFALRVVNTLALTKMRVDLDNVVQDELLVLAADQVLNAVHRINNHVGSVRAVALDLLSELQAGETVQPDDLQRRLQYIANEAAQGLSIPDELRKRIGGPQESVDVNDRVRAGLDAVRIPKNVDFVVDLPDGIPELACTALDLVVENLVLNAIEAMTGVGGQLYVSTSVDGRPEGQKFVVLTVTDTGVGMTVDQIESLFERRRAAVNRGRGLGFGMVWVKAWVRRTSGLIDVISKPGQGTTVTIRFQIDPETGEPLMHQGGEPR